MVDRLNTHSEHYSGFLGLWLMDSRMISFVLVAAGSYTMLMVLNFEESSE